MFKKITKRLTVASCLSLTLMGPALGEEVADPVQTDPQLTLKQVVDMTVEKFPRTLMVEAKTEEAQALHRRGKSLLPGPTSLFGEYISDQAGDNTGIREINAGFIVPLWKWGQRDAARALADLAARDAELFQRALRYEVTGLVREALWQMTIVENRHALAKQAVEVDERLVETIKRQVELGELARADLLLAESDLLEKKSLMSQVESELMHARRNYISLTRMSRMPASFVEEKSPLEEIAAKHPLLAASNIGVERAQANVNWVKSNPSGQQPSIYLGTKLERGARGERDLENIDVQIQIPFGGGAFNAPQVAQANLQLNQVITERETLSRQLEKGLHEAQHDLLLDKTMLATATERKTVAEEHLKMSRLGFQAGEIRLIDLLKIQANAQTAVREAEERALMLKRDISRYNQAVGELP